MSNNDLTFMAEYLKKDCKGKANAIKSRELEEIFSCSGAEIRCSINKLRQNGYPICSDASGYYYANTHYELKKTIEQLKHRAMLINSALTGLENININ